jgi:hypothetical protein
MLYQELGIRALIFLAVIVFHFLTKNTLERISERFNGLSIIWKVISCLKCLSFQTQLFLTTYFVYVSPIHITLMYYIILGFVLITVTTVSKGITNILIKRDYERLKDIYNEMDREIIEGKAKHGMNQNEIAMFKGWAKKVMINEIKKNNND